MKQYGSQFIIQDIVSTGSLTLLPSKAHHNENWNIVQDDLYLADYSQLDQLPLRPNFVFYSPQVVTFDFVVEILLTPGRLF